MRFALFIDKGSAELSAIDRTQLKDMPDLDAVGGGKLTAAFQAFITGTCRCNIGNDIRLKVAGVINVLKVGIRLVATSHEIRAG